MAPYLTALCDQLLNEQIPEAVRQLGGIQLKNALAGKSENERQRLALRWTNNIPEDVKNGIKQRLLSALASNSKPSAIVLAEVVVSPRPSAVTNVAAPPYSCHCHCSKRYSW